jgi:transcriptional regulator with XRE-family HTH domain
MSAAARIAEIEGVSIPSCTIISDFYARGIFRGSANALDHSLSYICDMQDRAPNHLRAWRKFRRMTQQDLADALGTAKSVISDLERGVVQLNDKWLRRLAPVLKVQPGHLLDYSPEELDTDIIDIWSRIDDDQRRQAAAVLRTFTNKTGTHG